MPEEIFVLLILSILGAVSIAITWMIIGYLKSRSWANDDAVTASELHHIIERAVRDGVEPLQQRLSEVERLQLPPSPSGEAHLQREESTRIRR
jgi:hypothetical protein